MQNPIVYEHVAASEAAQRVVVRENAHLVLVDEHGRLWVPGGAGKYTLAGASAAGGLTSRNRGIFFGDSRPGQGSFGTGSTTNNGMPSRGWWGWLQGLSGNYWELVQCAGVPNDTIEKALARFDSPLAGPLFGGVNAEGAQFGVSPFAPDWLFVELGINNISAGQSLSEMTAAADRLIAKMESTGARIVWLNESPVGSSTGSYSKAYFNRLRRWNDWLWQRQASSDQLLVVDVWSDAIDSASPNGFCKPNFLYDAIVHHGSYGARRKAELIWSAVQTRWGVQRRSVLPASRYDVYDAATGADIANRLSDPLCYASTVAASGTGNSGVVPTGYIPGNCGNATCVYSVVDHPSGYGKTIQMDVTFTAAGGFANLNTERIEALCAAGDVVRFGTEVFAFGLNADGVTVEPLTASHNLLTTRIQSLIVDAAGTRYYQQMQDSSNTEGVQVGSYNLALLTWQTTLGASPSRVQGQLYVVGAGAGKVRILFGRFAGFVNGGPQG